MAILLQMDEACRFIKDGREEQLRLALLLLDNAAELQMDWAIRTELQFAEMNEQMRRLALEMPTEERPARLQELVDWQPLTKSQRSAIDRYFGEKVDFLAGIPEQFNPSFAAPLKYLHKYRNQAYHRGEVRRDTLAISCRLLMEINSELLESLHCFTRSYAHNDDYSWLEQRYAQKIMVLFGDHDFVHRAATEFRQAVFVNDAAIAAALADHFEARVEGLLESLDFIVENSYSTDSRDEVFRKVQYFASLGDDDEIIPSFDPPQSYRASVRLKDVDRLRTRTAEIADAKSRIEAFRAYSVLEEALERFEDPVQDAAMQVDMAIQDEIDRARGK